MLYVNLSILLVLLVIFFLEGVFPHFPDRRRRVKHGFLNVVLGAISMLISTGMCYVIFFCPFRPWGEPLAVMKKLSLSPAGEAVLVFVLFDLWMYTWHRMNHRIPFLWRFHRVHHVDTEMDTTTALRFHPGEIIFSNIANFFIIPFIGIAYWQLTVYLIVFRINILFHHSNLAIPEKYDRILRGLIVTPNMHRVHHSIIRTETDSNYSSVFSIWDRLLSTFRLRGNTHQIILGIKTISVKNWFSFTNSIAMPFHNRI